MRKIFVLLFLVMALVSCAQELEVVSFEVDEVEYKTDPGEPLTIENEELSFSVKRINESAKKRYEFMAPTLDFLDNYNGKFISELDAYLILGSRGDADKKIHLYHFFKKKNNRRAISILVMCPYDENEKYKEQIYRVVKSAHF